MAAHVCRVGDLPRMFTHEVSYRCDCEICAIGPAAIYPMRCPLTPFDKQQEQGEWAELAKPSRRTHRFRGTARSPTGKMGLPISRLSAYTKQFREQITDRRCQSVYVLQQFQANDFPAAIVISDGIVRANLPLVEKAGKRMTVFALGPITHASYSQHRAHDQPAK